jgi:hypothetical protein
VWTIGDLIDAVLPLEPNRPVRVQRNFRAIEGGYVKPANVKAHRADSDDLARVYRFDLAQDSEMISPTIPI